MHYKKKQKRIIERFFRAPFLMLAKKKILSSDNKSYNAYLLKEPRSANRHIINIIIIIINIVQCQSSHEIKILKNFKTIYTKMSSN